MPDDATSPEHLVLPDDTEDDTEVVPHSDDTEDVPWCVGFFD